MIKVIMVYPEWRGKPTSSLALLDNFVDVLKGIGLEGIVLGYPSTFQEMGISEWGEGKTMMKDRQGLWVSVRGHSRTFNQDITFWFNSRVDKDQPVVSVLYPDSMSVEEPDCALMRYNSIGRYLVVRGHGVRLVCDKPSVTFM